MKHLFIVNPAAGGSDKTSFVRAAVREAFAGRSDRAEVYVTKGPMDAARYVRQQAQTGQPLRVYACGGDGTFNECVCGAAKIRTCAVCPFPTGTGNDFCRMFGPEGGLYRDLGALLDGREVPIDLIECNGRYSANICSVGIDARIGAEVHRYSGLPLVGGAGGYIVSAFVNVLRGINRVMRVRAGDFRSEGPHALVCACNGRFYGGGFNPSRDARPDDGLLEIFVVRAVRLPTLVRLIGRYAAGEADRCPRYIAHLRGTDVHIEFDEDNVINLDGETMMASCVDMRLVPGALRLIVPAGMSFFDRRPAEKTV